MSYSTFKHFVFVFLGQLHSYSVTAGNMHIAEVCALHNFLVNFIDMCGGAIGSFVLKLSMPIAFFSVMTE